jgi:hypothetical protein
MTNSANEWGDQCHASFSTGNSLSEAKEKSEIAVYALVTLELARGLDTLPSRCDLDEHTFTLNANRLVERDEFPGLGLGSLLVKGEAGIYFGRDTARDDGKDLSTEFDQLQRRHVSG